MQVAKLTATPEVAITLDDSKAFLTAVQNVARHYPIGVTQKAMDWGALIITTSLIYTPRIVAIRQRHAAAPKPPPVTTPVFHFVQPTPPRPPNGQAGVMPETSSPAAAPDLGLHDGVEPFA